MDLVMFLFYQATELDGQISNLHAKQTIFGVGNGS